MRIKQKTAQWNILLDLWGFQKDGGRKARGHNLGIFRSQIQC